MGLIADEKRSDEGAERREGGRLPDIRVFLTHTDHDTLVTRTTYDRSEENKIRRGIEENQDWDIREDGTGSVIAWRNASEGRLVSEKECKHTSN